MRTKKSEQAEKILIAAARLFATQRFHEVRMEDIAAAVCAGKGTLYRYFKDKEELYLALLDRTAAGLRVCIDEGVGAVLGPRAKLEAFVSAILEYFDANPYLFDLLSHSESHQYSGTVETWVQVRRRNIQLTMEILEEGRQQGLWNVPDPETPVLMMLGGLRAVLRLASPPRPAGLAKRIVEDFLNGAHRPSR